MKRIYRSKDSWVLCNCAVCAALNYVEPHGTTAHCAKCKKETEHTNIPHSQRDWSGCWYLGIRAGKASESR
jgi:hypothetical protein